MTVKRVPLQAATSALSALKLFADSNGDVIAHSGVKVGSLTRDTSLASGTQAVTGVGFKPSAVIFLANVIDTTQDSIGYDDGTNKQVLYSVYLYIAGAHRLGGSNSILLVQDNNIAIYYSGYISSLDSDGFTITWTKTGAKTGTADIAYLAFR